MSDENRVYGSFRYSNSGILTDLDAMDIDRKHLRVLLGSADATFHESIRSALTPVSGHEGADTDEQIPFEYVSAATTQDAADQIREAVQMWLPFALAFVDFEGPTAPQWARVVADSWAADQHLQVVLCTEQVDEAWLDCFERSGCGDRWIVLKRPFSATEVRQHTRVMAQKWLASATARLKTNQLECMVQSRTAQLQKSNERLQYEISERQSTEDQLRHNAFHDALTDLPNRAMLMERLGQCVERGKRDSIYQFAVLFLDLDNFKVINDSLGHKAGDELLRGIAERIETCLRALDCASRPADETTARLGGDEFVIILDGIDSPEDAEHVAQRIRQSLKTPFQIGGHEVVASLSMGIATSKNGYDSPDDILRDADTALYQSKEQGKGRFAVFNQDMRAKAIARMHLENDLRRVIEKQQLRLQYQPIVSLDSGRITGFEALVRWVHPQRGLISPAEFVPVAEETGLIASIGQWVLREACGRLESWRRRNPVAANLTVSVNLSGKELMNREFVDQIDRTLEQTGLPSRLLTLEITESVMLEDTELTSQLLTECKLRDIEVHMDDFGTGYSSLSNLHKLPIDAIKLDQTFVRNMSIDGKHAATVQAIIVLALNRGFKVIAEGVEREEDLVQLQTLDCHLAQGYFIARPLDPDAAEQLLLGDGGMWRKSA
jgi:diguanylate cyclase (GGDEF)-like protein